MKMENQETQVKPQSGLEAIQAAGLDWTLSKENIYLANKQIIPGHYANVRSDNGQSVGIVGETYQNSQNRTLASLMDRLFNDGKSIKEWRAGSFNNGARVYIQALLNSPITVGRDDVIQPWVTLTDTHDGTATMSGFLSTVRIICRNTLALALRLAKKEDFASLQTARHSKVLALQMGQVQENLAAALQNFGVFGQQAQAMLDAKMTDDGLTAFVKASGLVPNKDELSGKAKNILEEVSRLFQYGQGQDASNRGTVWAGLNAITEYVDHVRTTRGDDKTLGRLESSMFGSGAIVKGKAWANALELVKA